MTAASPSIQAKREGMQSAMAEGLQYIGQCPPHLREEVLHIPLPDGTTNQTKVVWPNNLDDHEKTPKQCPLIVYFHGGGFIAGAPDLVLAPARGFASLFNAIVVCPSLNQLPEQAYPAPIEIAWEVCAWLSDAKNLNEGLLKNEAAVLAADLSRGFVVGGVSAGGTVSAVVAGISAVAPANLPEFSSLSPLKAPLTGVFSGIPFLATEAMLPQRYQDVLQSRKENAPPEGSNAAMIKQLEDLVGDSVHTPWFSPLNLTVPTEEIAKNHPSRVFIYSCARDPFRDDAKIYDMWLSGLPGVQARLVDLPDESHMAWVSPPWPAAHTKQMRETTLNGMAWALGREWDRKQELPV